MRDIKYVKRDGFPRVRKTNLDWPTDCLGYDNDGIHTEIILYIRDDARTRPLLGIRRANIVTGVDGRPWLKWWKQEEIFPVSISECLEILDRQLVPAGWDKMNNCFEHWRGELTHGKNGVEDDSFIHRRLARKKTKTND